MVSFSVKISPFVHYCYVNCFWWLVRVTLVVAFGFLPKILGGSRALWMVLCHSMNAGSVVGISWGGGDTQRNLVELFYFQPCRIQEVEKIDNDGSVCENNGKTTLKFWFPVLFLDDGMGQQISEGNNYSYVFVGI